LIANVLEPIKKYKKFKKFAYELITSQRRSQNEAEEAMAPLERTCKIFRWCFISISIVRQQTEETVGLM